METLFCPFTRGKCNMDCVFNNGCFDEGNKGNCDLRNVTEFCGSWLVPDSNFEKQTNKTNQILNNIEINTSSDQTQSSQILTTINELISQLSKNQN